MFELFFRTYTQRALRCEKLLKVGGLIFAQSAASTIKMTSLSACRACCVWICVFKQKNGGCKSTWFGIFVLNFFCPGTFLHRHGARAFVHSQGLPFLDLDNPDAGQPPEEDTLCKLNKAVKDHAKQLSDILHRRRHASKLSKDELLRSSQALATAALGDKRRVSNLCKWHGQPAPGPTCVATMTPKEAAQRLEERGEPVIKELSQAWQARHVVAQPAEPLDPPAQGFKQHRCFRAGVCHCGPLCC